MIGSPSQNSSDPSHFFEYLSSSHNSPRVLQQRPKFLPLAPGISIRALKSKYEFAWALLAERPYLCKLTQALHLELIDYVYDPLGVEKVTLGYDISSPKRVGIVHVFTAVRYSFTDDSEEKLLKVGLTGLPLIPKGATWSQARIRQYGKEEPLQNYWLDELMIVYFSD